MDETTDPSERERDLVDQPSESLEVEYKEYLNLTDPIPRANLARHIAALANSGGGRIVVGITDDGKFVSPDRSSHTVSIDSVSSIVKKYNATFIEAAIYPSDQLLGPSEAFNITLESAWPPAVFFDDLVDLLH